MTGREGDRTEEGFSRRQAEIIRQLLAEKGITRYVIIYATGEGRTLPGSTYEWELELTSGIVVTEERSYDFLFGWEHGAYTLGENNGNWREIGENNELPDSIDEMINIVQKNLRQGKASQA